MTQIVNGADTMERVNGQLVRPARFPAQGEKEALAAVALTGSVKAWGETTVTHVPTGLSSDHETWHAVDDAALDVPSQVMAPLANVVCIEFLP